MQYIFSLLRFVSDPARGEFVNIGALAGDDDAGDWDFRLIQNLKRAKALDHGGRLSAALRFVDVVEERVSALEQLPEMSTAPISRTC